ncbi:MAG TPA: hypothetical protein VHO70_04630 [Chitinispirillaceae bacterium]|nr:hypothetical protein [Chitinispirillaceae bacterium]
MTIRLQNNVEFRIVKIIGFISFLVNIGCISMMEKPETKCSEFQKDNRLLGHWESIKTRDTIAPENFIYDVHFDTCSDLKSYCATRSYFEFTENDFDSIYNRDYCSSICNNKDTIDFHLTIRKVQSKIWFTINDSLFLYIGRFGTSDCIKSECTGLKYKINGDTLVTISNNGISKYYKKK